MQNLSKLTKVELVKLYTKYARVGNYVALTKIEFEMERRIA